MPRYLLPCFLLMVCIAFLAFRQGAFAQPPAAPAVPVVTQDNKSSQDVKTPNMAALPTYRIPFRLTDSKHLLVRAKINGKGPFHFIIDTGAPAVFIAKDTAAQIGLTVEKNGWSKIAHLEVEGGARVDDLLARLEDPTPLQGINALGLAGTKIDGIFGYNLLARFKMDIDFSRSRMLWTRQTALPDIPPDLVAITGGKAYTPPKSVAQMDSMAKMMPQMLGKLKSVTVTRGLLGIELAEEPVRSIAASGEANATKPASAAGGKAVDGKAEGNKAQGTKTEGKKQAGAAIVASHVRVAQVLADSPAAHAGVRVGDVIKGVKVGAAPMQSVVRNTDVMRLTRDLGADGSVRLQIVRGAQTLDVAVHASSAGL